MRIALVHYWLVRERGGEKVLHALHELYPEAVIFTNVHDPAQTPSFAKAEVRTSFIQNLPFAREAYQAYLPLMPTALESLDLSEFDLVISSESGPAKGVLAHPNATHLCYVHSPMRYIWNMYAEYMRRSNPLVRMTFPIFANYLRMWDVTSAARVDHFIANSNNVAGRVRRYWNRRADVLHPPVDVEAFAQSNANDGFYLYVGELVDYKRADIVVDAFARGKRKLIVIGGGKAADDLARRGGENVQVLGRVDLDTLRWHMARCKAVVFSAEEDFGIVPLEAMACGKPVIAFGAGGVLESVVPGKTGLFFDKQTPLAVSDAVDAFESMEGRFDPGAIRAHAETFATPAFKAKFKSMVERAVNPSVARLTAAR